MNNQFPDEAAKRLEAIISTATDAIITIDTQGIIESANTAVSHLFGYVKEELIGKNVSLLMSSPHQENHDEYLANYLNTGQRKIIGIGREVEGRKKDGTVFPLRLAVSEVKTHNRTLFTGILHDLSEVKQAQRQVEELNRALEEKVSERTEELASVINKLLSTNKELETQVAERERVEQVLRKNEDELQKALQTEKELGELKSRFVAMASHEFRTPLSTILSSAALLSRYQETEQQDRRDKHINRIKSAVNNLNAILNDFLSLSKLEEGNIKNNPVEFDFTELCVEVCDEVEGMLKPGQQIVHTNDPGSTTVVLDKHLLKNILYNLVSNAIKYSGPEKRIFCSHAIDNGELVIEIRDEGIGIPMEEQRRLFTRFFRASNATNIKGTGLGLNIVKSYLDLMNGTINFESELNRGTKFVVAIPIKRSA